MTKRFPGTNGLRWVSKWGPSALLALVMVGGPRLAGAGVADQPLPVLETGATTYHLFTVPGVIKNNNLETEFICTSLSTAPMRVGVEVFDATGSLLNNVSPGFVDGNQAVTAGGTVTIGTGNTSAIHEDEVITGLASGSVKNGSARILATSSALACSAFVADKFGPRSCTSSAITPAMIGESCTTDTDCGGCSVTPGCCQAVPTSMVGLKVIGKRKQRGE